MEDRNREDGPKRKAKNRHNQGSFRERRPGRWEGARWIDELGRRVTVTADTEAKARRLLEEKVREVRHGSVSGRSTKYTFDEYAELVIGQRPVKQRTRDKYRTDLRLYLAPLHRLRLDKITPAHLRTAYAALSEKGLSVAVRGHAHTLVRLVLETARSDGLIAKNPASVSGLRPKPPRGEEDIPTRSYEPSQADQILDASSLILHGEIVAFLIRTGMRRGEVAALRWKEVDLEKRTALVKTTRSTSGSTVYEGSPKTGPSRRSVPLSNATVALLKRQAALNAERHRALYPDRPESVYVFPTLRGTAHRPDNFRRVLQQILAVADERALETERRRAADAREDPRAVELLPRLAIHDLRHTFVSLMAAQGVRLEVIAAWIGDRPETMMRIYLHLFKSDTEMPDLELGERSKKKS
ncbi:tyrosine-type recombinase/integrase [Deinococcus alpinitundrae]|uniref:tyrosine-type recombinase/integrase n=1 Tax=Deinococcus alpinitundrae TaxID=468913 RepID=UPI00137AAB20|nr:site-specific integrase [Deinococcus alpinitundrae]